MKSEQGVATAAVRPVVWIALITCMGVGPLFLYSLSSVSAVVIDDLGLTSAQFGSIATMTFLSAAACSALFGRWADRVRSTHALMAISLGSGAGLVLAGLAPSYGWILLAAIACGVAQSMSNPATNRFVGTLDRAPTGSLIGWKQSGVQMSQLVAGLSVPALTVLFDWRIAIAGGALFAVVGVASGLALPTGSSSAPGRSRAASSGLGPGVWALTIYTYFIGLGLAAVNTYLPLYAFEELGFSLSAAGLTAAMIGLVGLVSRIWWGRRTDAGARLGPVLVLLGVGSLAGAAIVASAQWGSSGLVWLGAGVFGASALAANSVTMVSLLTLAPTGLVGAASGVLSTGLYLGFASGPVTFGLVLDHSSYAVAWAVPCAAFAVATTGAVLCLRRLDPAGKPSSSHVVSGSTPEKG
ncbi:MFS transporter [Aeromicrobium sp. CTD01-1L150]|uniref:MFS transporter n=1 Tax=Aeromicrobium sp. CTD01-1L150 TaxID=3341830 RepID=UPI0035BF4D86